MAIVLDGNLGITTPSETNTGTLSVTGVTTLTGGLNAALPVLSGGTGVTTKTGTGAVVLGTSPTITGATITVAATAAPAFSAYANAAQTISGATWTKVTFGVEDFDTNSNFASSTFTPTVAGYYQLNFTILQVAATSQTRNIGAIYKNGNTVFRIYDMQVTTSAANWVTSNSILLYANGTTDYFEVYGYMTGSGTLKFSEPNADNTSRFQAFLARSA